VTSATPVSQIGDARAGSPRVLLFGVNYWPEETGIAPYTTGLAEHLASGGADVTVVAGMPYYPQWRVPEAYRGRQRVRETLRGVTVLRHRQYVPARQTAARRALFEGSVLLNGLSALRQPRPDLVLGVVPNLAGGILAAIAGRRFGVPYGLIVQDLVGQAALQSGISGGGRLARVTAAIEGRVARGAAGVAVVAEGFRTHLESAGIAADRVQVLPNWTHVTAPRLPRAQTRAELGWPPEAVVALHAGNMGLKQGLEQVLDAARLALAGRPHLRFVLMGDGNQRVALETAAAGLPNVAFLDSQPAERFTEVLHAADVLLVTQRTTVTDMSLPSKLTSYFIAGRPVLAAVHTRSEAARAVERSGAGLVVAAGEPGALLEGIGRITDDLECSARMAQAGPAFARLQLDPADSLARAGEFVTALLHARPPAAASVISNGAA
jgi:glycosyltransferase involved in cell wall biosynthesis